MNSNILGFTYKKGKKKYKVITIFIFVSVIILNTILQTMSLSVQTLHNEMLNSTKLSLILMQDGDKNGQDYNVDVDKIKGIKNVKFAIKCKPLFLDTNSEDSFVAHAIDPEYSYYVGIENMEDNKLYCSTKYYKNIEKDKVEGTKSKLQIVEYDFDPPMIFSDSCFVSTNTYNRLVKENKDFTGDAVVNEYIIGVDNVKNVYNVVRNLDNLYKDDDPMFMYQASGLEGVVNDASTLLIILLVVFVLFIIFNTAIIAFLSSSLVNSLSRDLMILYLNGMSRKEISKQLSDYCRKYFTSAIIGASILSILVFCIVMQFVLHLEVSMMWIMICLLIDAMVILLNIGTIKLFIYKVVKKKTSNENISKIVRN